MADKKLLLIEHKIRNTTENVTALKSQLVSILKKHGENVTAALPKSTLIDKIKKLGPTDELKKQFVKKEPLSPKEKDAYYLYIYDIVYGLMDFFQGNPDKIPLDEIKSDILKHINSDYADKEVNRKALITAIIRIPLSIKMKQFDRIELINKMRSVVDGITGLNNDGPTIVLLERANKFPDGDLFVSKKIPSKKKSKGSISKQQLQEIDRREIVGIMVDFVLDDSISLNPPTLDDIKRDILEYINRYGDKRENNRKALIEEIVKQVLSLIRFSQPEKVKLIDQMRKIVDDVTGPNNDRPTLELIERVKKDNYLSPKKPSTKEKGLRKSISKHDIDRQELAEIMAGFILDDSLSLNPPTREEINRDIVDHINYNGDKEENRKALIEEIVKYVLYERRSQSETEYLVGLMWQMVDDAVGHNDDKPTPEFIERIKKKIIRVQTPAKVLSKKKLPKPVKPSLGESIQKTYETLIQIIKEPDKDRKKIRIDNLILFINDHSNAKKNKLAEYLFSILNGPTVHGSDDAKANIIELLRNKLGIKKPKTKKISIQKLSPVKTPVKRYTPYTETDLFPEDFEYKIQHIVPDADDDIEINPELILSQLENDEFILKIKDTLIKLYDAKVKKYTSLISYTPDVTLQDQIRQIITKAGTLKSKLTIDTIKKNLYDAVTDQDDGILSIGGKMRQEIRNYLALQIFILSRGYEPFLNSFNNIVLTGPPGVGKTKLAKAFAFVFSKIGILIQNKAIITSPKDLVGEHVGHTAVKTAKLLTSGLDGVIFIDEAYNIMPCKQDGELVKDTNSFGPESITEIVNFLDKFMGLSIVIVAGYEKHIKNCFLDANSGLSRRFPIRLGLPRYTPLDLVNIFLGELFKQNEIIDKDLADYIYSLILLLDKDKEIFANQAGDIINIVGMFYKQKYGNVKIKWEDSFENKKKIILKTFNMYLKNKGLKLVID